MSDLLKVVRRLCPLCMNVHDVMTVSVPEKNIFKGVPIEYNAVYDYCKDADEYSANEEMIRKNDISMKDAYRAKVGLLTSYQIGCIREDYRVSQRDLAIILGWGEKTITRYEGHYVQDSAHDMILRKIDDDPAWYLKFLGSARDRFSEDVYSKYESAAREKFGQKQDGYLKTTILAKYVPYQENGIYTGGRSLDLDKVVDTVNYFAGAHVMKFLYKVKLMKLLWYADALSYKRYGHSITGLAYMSLPMGAVPVGYDLITELHGINYEEKMFECGVGYKFLPSRNRVANLDSEEISVLDTVIKSFATYNQHEIVERMHSERAYIETPAGKPIDFRYADVLSIS